MAVEITGTHDQLEAITLDSLHVLYPKVIAASILGIKATLKGRRKFSLVIPEGNHERLFFKGISFGELKTLVADSAGELDIKGYPWWLRVNNTKLGTLIPDEVAAWMRKADEPAEDEGEPTRRTWQQALDSYAGNNSRPRHVSVTDGTKTAIGSFGSRHSLSRAVILDAVTGIGTLSRSAFEGLVIIPPPE